MWNIWGDAGSGACCYLQSVVGRDADDGGDETFEEAVDLSTTERKGSKGEQPSSKSCVAALLNNKR